jgi:hypothetical protein
MSAWSPFMCQMKPILSQKRNEVNSIVIVHMKSMNGGQEMTRNKGYYVADDAIMCSIEHQNRTVPTHTICSAFYISRTVRTHTICKTARITCNSKTIVGMCNKRAVAYIDEVDEKKQSINLPGKDK